MSTITLSSKYQIVIPKDVREKIQLKIGQKIVVIAKGGMVHLIPERSVDSLKGFLKGMGTEDLREDEER
ncbi:MAG: AbrB/MazE/SpoVT family DNA-binding domain-containing protein [Nitrospirota bacterium]|jgi:AbrB family looped-hinge helix DNA binding protein